MVWELFVALAGATMALRLALFVACALDFMASIPLCGEIGAVSAHHIHHSGWEQKQGN
jgi:hypothetical protein